MSGEFIISSVLSRRNKDLKWWVSVTARLQLRVLFGRQRIVHSQGMRSGWPQRAGLNPPWFPLFICFVSSLWACTMQIRASQEGGLFVLPEVLTRFQWFFLYSLFLGFSFCLLATTMWTPFSYFNYLTNITVTSIMLLLSHFSRVRLCATPPHWSGLPFPSPMHESEKWKWSRKSCPTFSDCMDCSPPGSFVHGIFQARVLEWGAIAFSDLYHS